MSSSNAESGVRSFAHEARVYAGREELEGGVSQFVTEAVEAGEPVLALVPGERVAALGRRLGSAAERVSFEDMALVGGNPSRIIPVMLDWIEQSRAPVRIVSEPIWPGRSGPEIVEVMRHEALIETALGGAEAALLCVFLEDAVCGRVLAGLECCHHMLRAADGSARHREAAAPPPERLIAGCASLEPPCAPVEQLPVTRDLRRLRTQIASSHAASVLSPEQRQDFVLAVNEVATNALQYGEPPQALRLWRRGQAVVGEVAGGGPMEDPLAGRRRPAPDTIRGRGLWLANQLCDLVELRSSQTRTTVRLHKRA